MALTAHNTAKLATSGTIGGISLCLSAICVCWLLRMKRVFRHDLQLLLMITDLVKSLAYLSLPIAALSGVEVNSTSLYCQFSGFLMAFTVEATDYLIVIMAFQTSRYVFRQYQNPEFGGLYEYRWTLNAFWIIIPGVMASLAFVNPEGGYVLVGAFCYVPAEPIWYRLCLAWIPRGFVFMIILITQSAIYIYIMRNVKACQEVEEGANMCRVLPNGDPCDRSQGDTLEVSTVRPCEMKDSDLENQTSQKSEWATGSVETSVNSNSSTYPSPEDSSHEYMNSQTSNMPEKRHEVQRQAKFLFIYPLIYIIMWIFPLVSQIIQYINKPQTVPFWVSCTWGIALGAHGGVDSIIFMIRERPWTKEKAPLPNWIRRIPKKFPKVPWVRRR